MLKMADNVEAELEAPEAQEIAKEDILLSKMDEERERYRLLLLLTVLLTVPLLSVLRRVVESRSGRSCLYDNMLDNTAL